MYTLYKPARKSYPRNRFLLQECGEMGEMDLAQILPAEYDSDKKQNYEWLLVCVDGFSRMSWGCPLAGRKSTDVIQGLTEIFKSYKPRQMLADPAGV